jgi:S-adenosylmethionine:tRNA ribosyltransferase-isomerase
VRLSDFDYDLPPERIAQAPLPVRDASRLLVVHRAEGALGHHSFRDLPRFLHAGDRLVVNDTRVVPARLIGRRKGTTGEVELLLTHPVEDARVGDSALPGPVFEAMVRPARKLTPGTVVLVGASEIPVDVVSEIDAKKRLVRFPEGFALREFLEREGHVPLPPYIRREDGPEDRERYQTVFALNPGAVAAPTAGLHFTPDLLEALGEQGIGTTRVTLHVGPGTFAPVTAPDPRDHVMEREYYRIPPPAAEAIGATRRDGGRIIAVGTTVVRTLETAAVREGDAWSLRSGEGWTGAFIHPPYAFRMVDALVTNFHLPRSTLLLLVSAFGGVDLVREAYREAVAKGYRFYSYGDAMLIV